MDQTSIKPRGFITASVLLLAGGSSLILALSLFSPDSSASVSSMQEMRGVGQGFSLGSGSLLSPSYTKLSGLENRLFATSVGNDPGVGLEAEESPAPVEILETFQVAGQILTVSRLDPINHQTSRITSCGQGVLYSTRSDGTLWVNLKGGIGAWTQVTAGTQGVKIACDRRHLYALHTDGTLYHANTRSDGQLNTINPGDPTVTQVWSTSNDGKTLAVPSGTDEIQGGMGNIYALVFNSSTGVGTLHSSELRQGTSPSGHVQGADGTWVQLANNLGNNLATGAGSKSMYTAISTSLEYRKTNRAFGANPDDTLHYNDTLLYGQNNWTSFPNAGLAITSITADDSNTMYALVQKNPGKDLVRFSFVEGNCTDDLDNDANGMTDAEDSPCRGKLATTWCQTRTGSYCIDRIKDTNGYSHALVTCNSGGQQPTIQSGRCTKRRPGDDRLAPDRAIAEPSGSGHYCNVIKSDGTWDFDYTGQTPCATLLTRHPRATIVRAGIYSTTGLNNVLVRCREGSETPLEGIGTAPLATAKAAVFRKKNHCVFTVSPKEMRVFNAPFPTNAWHDPIGGGRGYWVGHVFDHVPKCVASDPGCPCASVECPVELSQFGNRRRGTTNRLDNLGREVHADFDEQNSYDYGMNEGTPLRSLGYGRVVSSRDRDLSSMRTGGTTYQSEIYIRYDVGSDPTYAESFIAYYAHLATRAVITGQTVAPGQLIGYVGTTGASSDPHLHFGLIRLSNTNGRTRDGGEAFGYHIPFQAVLTNNHGYTLWARPGTIDPYGWRAGGIDPMAYRWSNSLSGYGGVTGIGAWSPQMWQSNEVPPYPAERPFPPITTLPKSLPPRDRPAHCVLGQSVALSKRATVRSLEGRRC